VAFRKQVHWEASERFPKQGSGSQVVEAVDSRVIGMDAPLYE
jgi:hypothetical protein